MRGWGKLEVLMSSKLDYIRQSEGHYININDGKKYYSIWAFNKAFSIPKNEKDQNYIESNLLSAKRVEIMPQISEVYDKGYIFKKEDLEEYYFKLYDIRSKKLSGLLSIVEIDASFISIENDYRELFKVSWKSFLECKLKVRLAKYYRSEDSTPIKESTIFQKGLWLHYGNRIAYNWEHNGANASAIDWYEMSDFKLIRIGDIYDPVKHFDSFDEKLGGWFYLFSSKVIADYPVKLFNHVLQRTNRINDEDDFQVISESIIKKDNSVDCGYTIIKENLLEPNLQKFL